MWDIGPSHTRLGTPQAPGLGLAGRVLGLPLSPCCIRSFLLLAAERICSAGISLQFELTRRPHLLRGDLLRASRIIRSLEPLENHVDRHAVVVGVPGQACCGPCGGRIRSSSGDPGQMPPWRLSSGSAPSSRTRGLHARTRGALSIRCRSRRWRGISFGERRTVDGPGRTRSGTSCLAIRTRGGLACTRGDLGCLSVGALGVVHHGSGTSGSRCSIWLRRGGGLSCGDGDGGLRRGGGCGLGFGCSQHGQPPLGCPGAGFGQLDQVGHVRRVHCLN